MTVPVPTSQTPSGDSVSCYEDAYGEEDPDEISDFDLWGNLNFNLGEDPIEAEAARKRKRNREEESKATELQVQAYRKESVTILC